MRDSLIPILAGAAIAAALALPASARQSDPVADAMIADCAEEATVELENRCLRAALQDLAGRMSDSQRQAAAEEPAPPPVTGLGNEQVMARKNIRPPESQSGEDARAETSIIDFSRTARGHFIFVLDNGQVWAQRDYDMNTDLRLDEDKTYAVEIEKGFLSGYRMRIPEAGRRLKVERLQ